MLKIVERKKKHKSIQTCHGGHHEEIAVRGLMTNWRTNIF